MRKNLKQISLQNFETSSGAIYDLPLSYEIFGQPLHTAPIVLVNHAFTGNSSVMGERAWWNHVVGENQVIDANKYTILAFNIPGNGYDGFLINNPEDFTTKDIARLFLLGLKALDISSLYALIGGSLGGAIAWEMLAISGKLAQNFVPIACDFKTRDWLHAKGLVQEYLLTHPEQPLQKARVHAMLCYRTSASFNQRFRNEWDSEQQILKSHAWLNYHGKALNERFTLSAYRLMNHLLMNINADEVELFNIEAQIHLVSVDSDLFFPSADIKTIYDTLVAKKNDVYYYEISSIHGHDAFLMEYEQLNHILKSIF